MLYAIADHVVDEYGPVVSELERDIDEVEVEVFSASRDNQALRVYSLKRQVLELRRNIAPGRRRARRPPRARARRGPRRTPPLLPRRRPTTPSACSAGSRWLRELLTDALNANLAQVSVHQNDDMRKISAWAAIIAAPDPAGRDLGHELR